MDGIHSAVECMKAWIQGPELIVYPINCCMHSSSNVQSHSRMHQNTSSQLASELNSCFLSGFVFHTFLCLLSTVLFFAYNFNYVRPSSDTPMPDSLCLYCTIMLLLTPSGLEFFIQFTQLDDKSFEFSGQ